MSYHPEFATLLDQHLAAQERSGAWLAQRLGRHPATVTRWRTGESLPGQPEMLQQVADLLGIHGAERQRLFLAAGYALLDAPGADAPPVRDTPPQSSPPETPTGQHAAAPTSNEPKGAPLDPPPAAASGRVSTKLLGSRYPTTYRQAEVATLQRWIELGASGLVLGLAGSGVSTLLRHLAHRPTWPTPTAARTKAVLPIWIEWPPASEATAATIYRALLRGLVDHLPLTPESFPAPLRQQAVNHLATTDPFVLQSTLFDLVAHCRQTETGLLLLFDRVGQLSAASQRNVGNTLRALRDHFPETVILFMGMRLSPHFHDQLFALGDLGRLLATHRLLVGALSEQDSLYVIRQRTGVAGVQPDEEEIEQFLLLSGGYPTLLKAVIRWWLTQSPVPPFDAFSRGTSLYDF